MIEIDSEEGTRLLKKALQHPYVRARMLLLYKSYALNKNKDLNFAHVIDDIYAIAEADFISITLNNKEE